MIDGLTMASTGVVSVGSRSDAEMGPLVCSINFVPRDVFQWVSTLYYSRKPDRYINPEIL